MVCFKLVALSPFIRAALSAAIGSDARTASSWDLSQSATLQEVAQTARVRHDVVLLFEFTAVTEALRVQLLGFRRAAPGAPICAILPGRKFEAEEIAFLAALSIVNFADVDTLANPGRLCAMLQHCAAGIATKVVLNVFRNRCSAAELKAVALCLQLVPLNGDPVPRETRGNILKQIRERLPHNRKDHARRFCLAVQLLLLLVLMKTSQQPLRHLYRAAGLASEDAARKSLRDYSSVTAHEALDEPSRLEHAAQILIDIVLGVRKPLRANRRSGDQEIRRSGDQEIKG